MIKNSSANQNNEVQVFIIKQVDYSKQQEFENKYAKFLGFKNFNKNPNSWNNLWKETKNFFNNFDSNKNRQTSYLIPLIYNKEQDNYGNTLTKKNISNGIDLNIYDGKEVKNIADNIYVNDNIYSSILSCPLLDYTKLAYVFQTNQTGFLGISDVQSFNVNLNVHQPSSCSITMNNFNFKYNFTYEDGISEENLFKSVFDTEDIVILRMAKRESSILNQEKYLDLYAKDKNDYFKTIFTGFINNVNESINWQSKNQQLNITCSGASKKISYKRLITGQAVCDKDVSSALVPISCYTIPQSLDKDNKPTLKNKEIIKNIAVRTMTSIEKIKDCWMNKLLFEHSFLNNASLKESNNEIITAINYFRNNYNNNIKQNFNNYIVEKDGRIEIYKNIFQTNETDSHLPSFSINGTEQPAYQYAFNQFNNLFVATYETVYQFIKKIADNLEFVFYDDQYGVIHFELIDTDIAHLYDSNDSNNFTQVISFSKEQNTDAIANIMTISTNSEYSGILEGQSLGILAVVRDPVSIEKYGERPMPPKPITGLTDKQACERYGRNLMFKMNRKINSYSLSLIGNPSIKIGKYGYLKDFHKLFYVESIRHQYTSGSSLISTVNCSYEREIIGRANELLNNPFEQFNFEKPKTDNKDLLFLTFKNYLNNKLSQLNINNYEEDFTKIWGKVITGEVTKNIINKIKHLYGYLNDTENLYLVHVLYSPEQIPYIYLDGYFWTQNFENDLYFQAFTIQQINVKLAKLKYENEQKLKQQNSKNKTKNNKKQDNKKVEIKQDNKEENKESFLESIKKTIQNISDNFIFNPFDPFSTIKNLLSLKKEKQYYIKDLSFKPWTAWVKEKKENKFFTPYIASSKNQINNESEIKNG